MTAPRHGQEAHVTVRATYRHPWWLIGNRSDDRLRPDHPAVVSWEPAPQPVEDTHGAADDPRHGDIAYFENCVEGGYPYRVTVVYRHNLGWFNVSGTFKPIDPNYIAGKTLHLMVRDHEPVAGQVLNAPQPDPEEWPVGTVMRDDDGDIWERHGAAAWKGYEGIADFLSPPLPWTRYQPGEKP